MSSPNTSPTKNIKRKKQSQNINEQNEPYWDIGKTKRVTVRSWKGNTMIDIREFYEKDDGTMAPGKKGISLTLQQYRELRDIIEDVDQELGEDKK